MKDNYVTLIFVLLLFSLALSIGCSEDDPNPVKDLNTISMTFESQISVPNTTLHGVVFFDSLTGWVCGTIDSVLHTSNGGISWKRQPISKPEFSVSVLDIRFITETLGWAVGGLGTIWKTTDGGESWPIQRTLSPTGRVLKATFFIDSNTGWALEGTSNILRTVDGGQTWTTHEVLPWMSLADVYFINDTVGWVVGSGIESNIKHTIDGGLSWADQPNNMGNWLSAVTFVNDSVGWVVGDGLILFTENGGTSWQKQHEFWGILRDVSFADETTGCAVGGHQIFYTNDAGQNWIDLTDSIPEPSAVFFGVSWIENNKGWLVGTSVSDRLLGTVFRVTIKNN